MNKIVIMGRISKDIELKTTNAGKSVANFSVAVNRKLKRDEADFFECNAWGKTGEFISQYFSKGRMIAITGEMQSRKYTDKNGNNRTVWEVNVDQAEFCGDGKSNGGESKPDSSGNADFEGIDTDEDLPF